MLCPPNVKLCPPQIVCETVLVVGVLTTTFVVAVAVQLVAFVTVTTYVPALAEAALNGVGDAPVPVKLLGPLQLYEAPPEALSAMLPLTQYGPVLLAAAVGLALIMTTIESLGPSQPVCVWLT